MPPKSALNLVRALQSLEPNEDVDGVPYEDIDGTPMVEFNPKREQEEKQSQLEPIQQQQIAQSKPKGGFVPSKWETVDPEEVKAQAVTTTSKWDLFEDAEDNSDSKSGSGSNKPPGSYGLVAYGGGDEDEDIDGAPMEMDDETSEVSFPRVDNDRGSVYSGFMGDDNSEERRLKLREVEMKVVAFQDDLESGRRSIKPGSSVSQMLQNYRDKLLRKVRY